MLDIKKAQHFLRKSAKTAGPQKVYSIFYKQAILSLAGTLLLFFMFIRSRFWNGFLFQSVL